MPLTVEDSFATQFVAHCALKEKQIQQNYRPVIGVHKWFARRPGSLFRALLLSEFSELPVHKSFYGSNSFYGTILDPFMGGGTPIFEANRVGFNVIGCDINPMAWWIVRQELADLDESKFVAEAQAVVGDIESAIGDYYDTSCVFCGSEKARVKYFMWVKQERCGQCGRLTDLFPGPLVASAGRHPRYVYYCPNCEQLCELPHALDSPIPCPNCQSLLAPKGTASRNKFICRHCGSKGEYPNGTHPPSHRLFAIEYHCEQCRPSHRGRFFKTPDAADLERYEAAVQRLRSLGPQLPQAHIPSGDETRRLHRWGYKQYVDLFNERQLLGLGLLAHRISQVQDNEVRYALATVFSDTLRYQNMLCRYDTWALKCQDIFNIHGYPVGLVQCENNLVGIPKIGSGGFRHFIDKYLRAKRYCSKPFESVSEGKRKTLIYTSGERIAADFVSTPPKPAHQRNALLVSGSVEDLGLSNDTVDGVFTDPPYFDNVQYAELIDFCYVWLRLILNPTLKQFESQSTRSPRELTGNATQNRGLSDFAAGLSQVFVQSAHALKHGRPFVFTYHHNNPDAYLPVIIAILDACLICTEVHVCPAEMGASTHINGTKSSVVDSIFVCRHAAAKPQMPGVTLDRIPARLERDKCLLERAGVRIREGDIRCMLLGYAACLVVGELQTQWNVNHLIDKKLREVRAIFRKLLESCQADLEVDQRAHISL